MGLGTWAMGERAGERAKEVAALRRGVELGMTLIDTAEMYAEGGAEEVVGEAVAGHARWCVPGEQGLSAQCVEGRGGGGL